MPALIEVSTIGERIGRSIISHLVNYEN